MFPDPSEQQKAPFPILPSAILTLTYLAAAYPHLDIVEDKIVTRFGLGALQQSIDYTVSQHAMRTCSPHPHNCVTLPSNM